MIIKTNQISPKGSDTNNQQNKERTQNVTIDSEKNRISDESFDIREFKNQQILWNNLFYKKFFQEKIKQSEITPNLHKKAINWLITFCWTRNYSEEILWYSIGYFYSYYFSIPICKDRLTLICKFLLHSVISSISLSLKLLQDKSALSFEIMKSLLNNKWSIQQFIRVQQEIIALFEFDLYFPTVLRQILHLSCSQEQKSKILFVTECCFLNGYEVAINDLLLEDIQLLINRPQSVEDLKQLIRRLSTQSKVLDVLKQKYSSKFNIDDFLINIIKEK